MAPILRIHENHELASSAAASLVGELLHKGGLAALAGGRTPRNAYQRLAKLALPWSEIQLVASDERLLPDGDPERNDTLLDEYFGRLGCTRLHFDTRESAEAAASDMEQKLKPLLPLKLALLGLGEDGHTASLFPGNPALQVRSLVAPVHDAAKPPPDRVTLSYSTLNTGKAVVFLVTGAGKGEALHQLLHGENIPASHVQAEQVWVFADRAAAGQRS